MEYFNASGFPFRMHSIHIMHKGEMLQEEYYAPYTRRRLHRMFSITKSFTSLAIGALIAEGRLDLNDRICSFFPEYLPDKSDPLLQETTIEDMLTMRTCNRSTTYKLNENKHWVRSFFTTAADHAPGSIFKYDTSSAHTLAALVYKLSGKGVLDYLREVFLDRIGFSQDAYIIKDPYGCEMGGTGLMAYPEDLLKTAAFLMSILRSERDSCFPDVCGCADSIYDSSFFKRYDRYIKDAMQYHCATLHEGKTIDEMQGYGYQFWLLRNGGVMMYGMGGQYMVLYPGEDLIFITTADSQPVNGGTQYILDEIRRIALYISPGLSEAEISLPDTTGFPIKYGTYRFKSDRSEFSKIKITGSELILSAISHDFVFPYSLEQVCSCVEKVYGQQIHTTAMIQPDKSLYINVQILDEYTGSIHILIKPEGDRLCMYLRKIEESLYTEFNGFFDAYRE